MKERIDPSLLTNEELATCVDEFVQRAIHIVRSYDISESVTIVIGATQYGQNSEYTIDHKVSIGYVENYISKTNSLTKSAQNAVTRFCADKLDEPQTIRPMLAAPIPEPTETVVDAEFSEVEDDNVPF